MAGAPRLSLIAPAHNEQDSLPDFLREARGVLGTLGTSFEIICVDDGSTDGTFALLQAMKGQVPELRVARLVRRAGQSAAVAAGIEAARGSVIALMDADLQNDPRDLATMLAILEGQPGVAAVVGRRAERQDSWVRRCSSRIANRLGSWIMREPTADGGCGIKLFRADVLKRIRRFRGMHRFLVPLARLDGAVVAETDVNHRPRLRGQSKYGSGLGRAVGTLCDALAVRWMQERRLPGAWEEV